MKCKNRCQFFRDVSSVKAYIESKNPKSQHKNNNCIIEAQNVQSKGFYIILSLVLPMGKLDRLQQLSH